MQTRSRYLATTSILVAMLVSPTSRAADPEGTFAQLRAQVAAVLKDQRTDKIDSLKRYTSSLEECNNTSSDAAAALRRVRKAQYIYNAAYTWEEVSDAGGVCVYLVKPFERALSVQEAADLVSASRLEFPITPSNSESHEAPIYPAPISGDEAGSITLPQDQSVAKKKTVKQ